MLIASPHDQPSSSGDDIGPPAQQRLIKMLLVAASLVVASVWFAFLFGGGSGGNSGFGSPLGSDLLTLLKAIGALAAIAGGVWLARDLRR